MLSLELVVFFHDLRHSRGLLVMGRIVDVRERMLLDRTRARPVVNEPVVRVTLCVRIGDML